MKRKIYSLIMLVTLSAVFASASFAASRPVKRIKFARGATRAVAAGTLVNYRDKQSFVIRVNEGQTLSTEQFGGDRTGRYVTVAVRDPNGEYVGDADASCNSRKEISPTVAGDYRLEVVECRKADPWRGTFNLRVTVR